MKTIYSLICISLFSFNCFSQNNPIEDKINKDISALFFGLDIINKPIKIEEEYRQVIGHEPGDKIYKREQNGVKFKKHAMLSGFIDGYFNVTYFYDKRYFDDFGLYQAKMTLTFPTKDNCISEYNKLVKMFELFGTTKVATTSRSEFDLNVITSEETVFTKRWMDEFPRLVIRYFYDEDELPGYITITYIRSWDDSKLGGFKFYGN